MALFRTNAARNNLNDWLNQNPGNGSNNYSASIGAALANAASRQTPAQRYNTGSDQNMQANRTNYRLMAQAAADNAAAGTKALSGGYDASYADSAAAQGYQTLMEGQHDAEAQLRQLALEGMAAEDSQSDVLTAALLGAQQLEMNANQMAQDRYQMQRDFLTNEVTQAQAEQDNFWSNVWNSLVWAANVALQTYDNYKGYSQQQFENELAKQRLDADLAQQALENERWNIQYNDSRSDAEWDRNITERQIQLEEMGFQDDHALALAQLEAMEKAAAGGGSSGSGGSYSGSGSGYNFDMGDYLDLVEEYQNASLAGEDAVAQDLADLALQRYGRDITGGSAGGSSAAKTSTPGMTAQRGGSSSYGSGNTVLAGGIPVPVGMGYQDDALLSALSGLDSNNGMAMNNMSDSDMIRYLISLGYSNAQIQNIMNGMG